MTAPHASHPTAADLAAFAVGKLTDADARAVAAHLEHLMAVSCWATWSFLGIQEWTR